MISGGIKVKLIRLDSFDIRSKIWRQSLNNTESYSYRYFESEIFF